MEKRTYKKDLPTLRRSLDAIDQQLVLHMIQRFKLSEQIAAVKYETQLETTDLQREQVLLEGYRARSQELGASLDQEEMVIELMQAVIKASKQVQETVRQGLPPRD